MFFKAKYEIVEHTTTDNNKTNITYSLRRNYGLFKSYEQPYFNQHDFLINGLTVLLTIITMILSHDFNIYCMCLLIPIFYIQKLFFYLTREEYTDIKDVEAVRDSKIKYMLSKKNKPKKFNKVINTTIVDNNQILIKNL